MKVRHKLLIATSIPIVILVVQVLSVNHFIHQLHSAVGYIGSAHALLEAKFGSTDHIAELQENVKQLPLSYTQSEENYPDLSVAADQLDEQLRRIKNSSIYGDIETSVTAGLEVTSAELKRQIAASQRLISDETVDIDSLLEQAITANNALLDLDTALDDLAIHLRGKLQLAIDAERRIRNRPIVAGVIIGALAIVLWALIIWFFIDKYISRPLTVLAECMLSIAAGKHDATLPEYESTDEIGAMNRAMRVFRENAIEVADNNLKERALARKRRQYWLENLASFLKHELKNKQIGAEQSIELLMKKDCSNPLVTRYGGRAIESLSNIRSLVDSAVHAADIESALLSEVFTLWDAENELSRYVEQNENLTGENLLFINELVDSSIVFGDKYRLEQLLDKLVYNAIDFHDSGTDIIVRARHGEKDTLIITVENQGPPLPADAQRLFELSVTSRKTVNRRQDNVGFGLFIARRIVEYHHGEITAHNEENGPVFTIVLPVIRPEQLQQSMGG